MTKVGDGGVVTGKEAFESRETSTGSSSSAFSLVRVLDLLLCPHQSSQQSSASIVCAYVLYFSLMQFCSLMDSR